MSSETKGFKLPALILVLVVGIAIGLSLDFFKVNSSIPAEVIAGESDSVTAKQSGDAEKSGSAGTQVSAKDSSAQVKSGAQKEDPYALLGKSPLVVVGPGVQLTLRDIDQHLDPGLSDITKQLYQERLNVIRSSVTDYVLTKESGALGITKETLLNKEVNDKLAPVADSEVEAFIERNHDRMAKEAMEDKNRIKLFLHNQRVAKMQGQYIASLVDKYGIKIALQAPVVRTYDLDSMVRLTMGNPDAPIHLVEFSDFECPYCRKLQPELQRISEEYGDKVKISFKHFPLPNHRGALYTSLAAECANDQGKFWDFKFAIFKTAKPGDKEQIRTTAQGLGLDMTEFESCFSSEKHRGLVEKDLKDGRQVKIAGTPTVFVNGERVVPASYKLISQAINKYLKQNTAVSQNKPATKPSPTDG